MSGFGERLQGLMDRKIFSQKDLADHFGYHRSLISKWISYKEQKPRRETVQKIASFFGCDIEWLATGNGEPFPSEKTETAEESPFLRRRQTDMRDEAAIRIRRDRFKLQCLGFFDVLFDFVGDCYGEDQEAINDFMTDINSAFANYRRWKEEKKERSEGCPDRNLGGRKYNNGAK